jgi:hypothetical protein
VQSRNLLNVKAAAASGPVLDDDTVKSGWGVDRMPHGSTEDMFYTVGSNFRGIHCTEWMVKQRCIVLKGTFLFVCCISCLVKRSFDGNICKRVARVHCGVSP